MFQQVCSNLILDLPWPTLQQSHGLMHLIGEILIFLPPKELWEAYSNRTVRQSIRPSLHPAFVSGPYLLYSLRKEFQIWLVDTSWDGGVSRTIFGSL